jgi:hypothetical protein
MFFHKPEEKHFEFSSFLSFTKNNFSHSVGLLAGVFFARAKMRERS